MGAEEEMVITLSGGAPWGFRLQGGSEQKKPLQVSKVGPQGASCGQAVLRAAVPSRAARCQPGPRELLAVPEL